MPRLLARAYCSNEHTNFDCDYVEIDLTPEYAQSILAKVEVFKRLKNEQKELEEMRYWDYSPRWFATAPEQRNYSDEIDHTEEQSDDLSESIDALDLEGWQPAPEALTIPEWADARTECDRLVIQERDVMWSCSPKHSNEDVTTPLLDVAELEKIAAGREVTANA